jgi:hypothetical protein
MAPDFDHFVWTHSYANKVCNPRQINFPTALSYSSAFVLFFPVSSTHRNTSLCAKQGLVDIISRVPIKKFFILPRFLDAPIGQMESMLQRPNSKSDMGYLN